MKTKNNDFLSLSTAELDIPDLHQYLLSAVAPRPIAFASTRDKEGNVNLSPFSFFNVFGANPPLLIFSPARRVRGNTLKHTLLNVMEHPEVVVNMVDYAMVEQMSLSSTEYEAGVNEFIKAGFTQVDSDEITVPRVGEAPVAMECIVEQVIETGEEGGAGNLVICKVIKIHIRKDILDEQEKIDPLKLDLVARMGGSWYCRANESAMFEIPKPIRNKGIGVDQLPPTAQDSRILTGNNLGRLGNMESIPSAEEISQAESTYFDESMKNLDQREWLNKLHRKVQILLGEGEDRNAMALLWLAEKKIGE